MHPLPSDPQKIFILHSGGIGDLLLALPAMRIFRHTFPHSELELMGRPERISLVAFDLEAKSIHSIDQAGMAFFYGDDDSSLPPKLSFYFSTIDIALVFGKSDGRNLARNLARAGVRRVIQISPFPKPGSRIHVSDYILGELRAAGLSGEDFFYPLRLPEEAHILARNFWAEHRLTKGKKILAIHPGSGSQTKNWDPQNFAGVADWAASRGEVLLVSGPARDGFAEVIRGIKQANPAVAHNLPLLQLAAVLKECHAYLGNDSGITHLAALLGIPTVAIFGATDPFVWGPRGPGVHIISGDDPGLSCTTLEDSPCSRQTPNDIGLDRVIKELATLWAGPNRKATQSPES